MWNAADELSISLPSNRTAVLTTSRNSAQHRSMAYRGRSGSLMPSVTRHFTIQRCAGRDLNPEPFD
jgi:hypothetical protein